MAKFRGKIGFIETKEKTITETDGQGNTVQTPTGVWEEQITERLYYGDVINTSSRFQSSGDLNDNVIVSNEISVVADPFAKQNLKTMRYVEFMATKWKISNIRVQYPRLILTLGDVYNG